MIKSIRTKNLYGRYNYFFDFSKNKMTIISGPNGYGKTTILKIIRDVLDDDLFHLASIPFEEIELISSDNKKLLFVKDDKKFFINNQRVFVPLTINWSGRVDERIFFTIRPEDIDDIKKMFNKVFISQQQLLTINGVISSKGEDVEGIESTDLLLRINAQIAEQFEPDYVYDLLSFYKSVGNTIYSGADRLYRDYGVNDGHLGKRVLKEVIDDLPKKIDSVFNAYDNEYTSISNSLDYYFMSKLSDEIKNNSKGTNAKAYTKEDYEKDRAEIDNQRKKLFSYNFLADSQIGGRHRIEFNKEYNLVFKIFNENYKKKMNILKGLTDKLDLFVEIVNKKLSNKSIAINRAKGNESIAVKDGNNTILLKDLSSGEKEIIIMYYKMIFESNDKIVALIDEPEISSHVSWQYEVLDDFDRIMQVNKNVSQIIVCTHSPQIVNDRWDQTIDLFEEDNKNNVE